MESQHSKCIESIETLLQYSPNPWVPAPCFDVSRSRNSTPKSPNIENSPACIHPPPSPPSTKIRTSWRTESRPVLHAEFACHRRLPVAALVGALLAESVPIFVALSFFCPPQRWAPGAYNPRALGVSLGISGQSDRSRA